MGGARVSELIEDKRDLHRPPSPGRLLSSTFRNNRVEESKRRVRQLEIAKFIENARNGSGRTPKEVLERLRRETGIPARTLEAYRVEGEKWRALCGPFEGLMLLVRIAYTPIYRSPVPNRTMYLCRHTDTIMA